MKQINAIRKIKGESVEYVKSVPENARDCFELFRTGTAINKKDMDEANSALRPALEAFFSKASFVSADYMNRAIIDADEDVTKLVYAHEVNAVKAFNGVQTIIFGSSAHHINVLDYEAVRRFCDSFAVLFRGRFTRVQLSEFGTKQFTLATFREACELFAGFEQRRREGIAFEAGAIIAEAVNAKRTKNARKRAARAAKEATATAARATAARATADEAADNLRESSEKTYDERITFIEAREAHEAFAECREAEADCCAREAREAVFEADNAFAEAVNTAKDAHITDALSKAANIISAARLSAKSNIKALEEPVA